MFDSLLSTIACLSCMLLIGFLGGKLKILDATSTEKLSELIVKIGQPFLIVNSAISQKYSPENLKIGLSVFALGICMHAFMALVAFLFARPLTKDLNEKKISQYCMFFANCGFIGFPIVEAIYGPEGLFYGAFYIMSFHLFVWTLGIVILAKGRDDIKITPKKILLNYGTVPCAVGFLLFVSNIPLPAFFTSLTSSVANICTPIAIMISGANIARRSLKQMFLNPRVYHTSSVKLLAMPLLVATITWLLGLPDYMVIFGTIMAAMPCAAVVTMFCEMYRIIPGFAAELVGSSTVFCTVTIIPVVSYAQWLVSLR